MDKYEYKIRADEIKELIAQGEYAQAAEIADTIDWRRVKSVMMLCTISDLYKINRRYEDARDMLLLAYERRPGGRTICYSLCELSIKMEEYVQAVEYYKEFVQVAPRDSGRYILQYKLYEAQDVSLEERIEVLEELKKRDYREKWAYELAYLYHRVGLATRCVEECDEMILWFGEGKYVIKAMELKMLHQPLTQAQQEKYDSWFGRTVRQKETAAPAEPAQGYAGAQDHGSGAGYEDPQYYGDPEAAGGAPYDSAAGMNGEEQYLGNTREYGAVQSPELPQQSEDQAADELDIHVKTMDVGQYNTINLQAELAAGLREVLGEDTGRENLQDPITRSIVAPMMESDTETFDYPQIDEVSEEDLGPESEEMEGSEVFFGETGEIGDVNQAEMPETEEFLPEEPWVEEASVESAEEVPGEEDEFRAGEATAQEEPVAGQESVAEEAPVAAVPDATAAIVMEQMRQESTGEAQKAVWTAEPPKELAGVLSQESDGQISLVMPERENIEKQITGQMSIEDILAEWERMKKENEEKRKEEVRRHVLQQTGTMFTEFEASVRDGLLEQLESGKIASVDAAGDAAEDIVEEIQEDWEQDAAEEGSPEPEEAGAEPEEAGAEPEEPSTEPEEAGAETEESAEDTMEFYPEELPEEPEDSGDETEEVTWEVQEDPGDVSEDAMDGTAWESQDEFLEDDEEAAGETAGEEAAYAEEMEENLSEEPEWQEDDEAGETERPAEDKQAAETWEKPVVERDKAKVRGLTREEKELFAPFVQSRSAREQLVQTIDNISLAAYTGNIIITGEEGMDTLTLARNMIREVQMEDSNFSGKVAKISGKALNKKNVEATVKDLKNGALIILKASGMDQKTANALHKSLQQETTGIIVVLEDTKKAMNHFLADKEALHSAFTARMDVEALSNDTLVAFGRQYAREKEYSINDMGVLALHTRIADLQTSDHVVTVVEVKEIVDEAIRHANRKTVGHFFDVLLAKRYDDEDMIVLGEKDFA